MNPEFTYSCIDVSFEGKPSNSIAGYNVWSSPV